MSYSPRSDSWAGQLSEDEQCLIFDRWLRSGDSWENIADWAVAEFDGKIDRKPSRTSMYGWREHFRPIYNRHESEKVRQAGELVAEYAHANEVTDKQYISALKAIGSKAMVAKDAKTMAQCIRSAMEIEDRLMKAEELEIKGKAQATKEADLALAREKFEFDAAKRAMDEAAKIKTVAADDSLDDDEKIARVREVLFG